MLPNPNHPPTANAGSDHPGVVGQFVTLQGLAPDPDGDPLTYLWSVSSGNLGSVTLGGNATLSLPRPSSPVETPRLSLLPGETSKSLQFRATIAHELTHNLQVHDRHQT